VDERYIEKLATTEGRSHFRKGKAENMSLGSYEKYVQLGAGTRIQCEERISKLALDGKLLLTRFVSDDETRAAWKESQEPLQRQGFGTDVARVAQKDVLLELIGHNAGWKIVERCCERTKQATLIGSKT